MFSSERGIVAQYDLPRTQLSANNEGGFTKRSQKEGRGSEAEASQRTWSGLFDARGQTALALARRHGMRLETLAYSAHDDYTIYLPSA